MTPKDRLTRIKAIGFQYQEQPLQRMSFCNLCDSSVFVTITHEDRYGYHAPAGVCLRCGLTFLNPQMAPSAYEQFYTSVYRPLVSAYHNRLINAQTIQGEQKDYAKERGEFLEPFLQQGQFKTLLDIGGSTGVVSAHFEETYGLKPTVLAPSPDELDEARARAMEVITGLIEDTEFGGRKFDLVLLCQTVDHLLDIKGTLQKVREVMHDGSIFFVDMVDFRAAYLRNWNINEAVKIDHPYYLSEATMEAYLARTGFELLGKAYATDHLHISYVCKVADPTPDVLPDPASVRELLSEIRYIQNTNHRWNS